MLTRILGPLAVGSQNEESSNQALGFLLRLLEHDARFAGVYREVGIGDMLFDMVEAFARVLLCRSAPDASAAKVMTKEVAGWLFQVVTRLIVGSDLDRDEFIRRRMHVTALDLVQALTTQGPALDLAMEVCVVGMVFMSALLFSDDSGGLDTDVNNLLWYIPAAGRQGHAAGAVHDGGGATVGMPGRSHLLRHSRPEGHSASEGGPHPVVEVC